MSDTVGLVILTLASLHVLCWAQVDHVSSSAFKTLFNLPVNLAKELLHNNETKTLVFSPNTIQLLMMTCFNAAAGHTRIQIGNALFGNETTNEDQERFKDSIRRINYEASNYVSVQKDYKFRSNLREKLNQEFGSWFPLSDYSIDDYVQRLNLKIEMLSTHKIINMVNEDYPISPHSSIVLISGLHFEGIWNDPFYENSRMDFFVDSHRTISVEMIKSCNHQMDYYDDNDLEALRKFYKNGDNFMVVVLPKKKFGLKELISKMTVEKLNRIFDGFCEFEINASLPKFNIEGHFDLTRTIENLGISTNNVDFSELLENPNPIPNISKFLHKAIIVVEEMVKSSNDYCSQSALNFVADRPFLFMIVNGKLGNDRKYLRPPIIVSMGQYYG